MRSHIQQGEPVHNCAHSLMEAASLTGERLPLTSQEQWYLERMLYDGYFAFEAMTARKWDDGVCGTWYLWDCSCFWERRWQCKELYPSKERAGIFLVYLFLFIFVSFFANYWHQFLNLYLQITYSEPYSGEVDVDEFWKQVDLEMIQRSAFVTHGSVPPLDASKIAPWIPPVNRSASVLNTEMEKGQLSDDNDTFCHQMCHYTISLTTNRNRKS